MKILIAEDERDLNAIIQQKLTEDGYSTDVCFDGEDALYYLQNAEYDAAIVDVMMPKKSGFDAVKQYRDNGGKTPVIFLTARDSIEDKVKGLDIGANDYITKPFSFAELMARIRAAVRKSAGNGTNIYTAGDLTVNTASKTVTRAGKNIHLSAREYSLLEYMIRNKNTVLSREQIENNLYNFNYDVTANVVDVYIRYLRRKIDDEYETKLIRTVRGHGYTLTDNE